MKIISDHIATSTFIVLSLFGLFGISFAQVTEPEPAGLDNSILFVKSTVIEPTGKNITETGTGFLITSTGYALTAGHIVSEPGAKVTVILGSNSGAEIPASVLSPAGSTDAVLLELPASHRPYKPVALGNAEAVAPDGINRLMTRGFPLGLDISSASGGLSNKGGGNTPYWQITIPLNHGNSGSPVFDGSWRVVGMVIGGISEAQQINYMIPLNQLGVLLMDAGLAGPPWREQAVEPPNWQSPPAIGGAARPGGECHEITETSLGPSGQPIIAKRRICS